jgi:protein TonB
MSSASLAVAHRAHPDRARIAALSAAIALNLAVIVIASRPITPAQLSIVRQLTPVVIRFISPPTAVQTPPPIALKPLPHPPTSAPTHLHPTPTVAPVLVPSSDGQIAMPMVTSPTPTADGVTHGDPVTAAPVEASLAYRLAPLNFLSRRCANACTAPCFCACWWTKPANHWTSWWNTAAVTVC